MRKKIVTAIATNGACAIHDFEVAMAGHTSEDVAAELCSGTFGMSKDTGRGVNLAINRGVKKGYGIGKAVGEYISSGEIQTSVQQHLCHGIQYGCSTDSPCCDRH